MIRIPPVCLVAIAALAFALRADAAIADPGDFHLSPFSILGTGTGCQDIKAVDLDRDGRPDIVAAMPDGNVAVFLNDGHGAFPARVDYPGGTPVAIDVGDFDGDGWIDVATSHSVSGIVSLRLNDRTGHLGAETDVFVGSQLRAIAGADLDGDGVRDLAVVQFPGRVWILRGLGNGTFATPSLVLSIAGQLFGMRAGDCNRDGRIDLVVASFESKILIVRNTGGMHFSVSSQVPVPQFPADVELVDVDQDGDVDIASATLSNVVAIRLNDGLGHFSGFREFQIGDYSQAVTAADLNLDGAPDLVCSSTLDNNVAVLPNLGGGAFGLAIVTPSGAGTRRSAIGDFDGDGRPDVVAADQGASTLHVLRNHPGALDSDGIPLPGSCDATRWAVGNEPSQAVAVDLNADGRLDLAVAGSSGPASVVFRGANGDIREVISGSGPSSSVGAGDLDGDGRPDLALARPTERVVDLFRNLPGGFVPLASLFVDGEPTHVVVADLNGDGAPDIATANDHGPDTAGSVSILFSPASGGFQFMPEEVGERLDPDPVPVHAFSHELVDPPNARLDVPVGVSPTMLAAGDLDHDGKMDLVVNDTGSSTVSVLMGIGQGRFAPRRILDGLGCWTALGDLDGDGLPEIVVADPEEWDLLVFRNLGSGNFAPYTRHPTDRHARSVAIGDVDDDGRADLVYVSSNGVSGMLLNRGGGSFIRGADCWMGSDARSIVLAAAPEGGLEAVVALSGDDEVLARPYPQAGAATCPCGLERSLASDRVVSPAHGSRTYELHSVHPNPTVQDVKFDYALNAAMSVNLAIFTSSGRLVRTLVNQAQNSGDNSVTWDGRAADGSAVPRGIYFYRFTAIGRSSVGKIVVTR